MRRNVKKIALKAVVATFVLLSPIGMSASIAQNILSAIQINPDGNSYQIILKSDAAVPIKKVVESSDKIYLELQNIDSLSSVNTIYNNVPNVDNVIVQPLAKNSVKILVQGKNIDQSKIRFETLSSLKNEITNPTVAPTVELNPPINAYPPIFEEEPQEENSMFSTANVFAPLIALAKKGVSSKNVLYVVGFSLIVLFALRSFKKNNRVENSRKIGLSQSLGENLQSNKYSDIGEFSNYAPVRAKATDSYSSHSLNYGLKNYRNSQKSPYSSSVKRTPFQPTTVPVSTKELKSNIAPDLKTKVMTATLNSHAAGTKSTQATSQTVDSFKFIESMTKIYEKNGRNDLATGLRNNLRKAQIKQF